MSEEDDFDIVPDDEEIAPRSTWLWISITAVVALFAFGVGAAFMLMTNRMGPGAPTPPPTVAVAIVTTTVSPAITGTVTVSAGLPLSITGTPMVSPTVTITPTATPTPSCSQQPDALFVPLYDQAQLGCAMGAASTVWAAYQPFERGSMLWRSDTDTSYVFYSSGGWFPIEFGWDGGPARDRGSPPPGLQAPQRGFGYVWSLDDEIFNGLGWARDQEKGFCAFVQEFERGFILRSSEVASCTPENLYNFATAGDWTPLLYVAVENAQWRNVPSPTTPAEQGGERPGAGVTRPAPHGIFDAPNATGFTIDGRFDEWPDGWRPINTLIRGAELHTGPGDLSANFQVAWNDNGLLLAVRVNDDIFRTGPIGSNMWQGDGIEVQFDRLLAEDFNSTSADADDYQIGIAFDENQSVTRGYVWLPFANEQELAVPSAVTLSGQGYQLEALIPWYVFEVDAPSTERAYGFNISINDNDSDAPAQETVLSASTARTTHDNPTEWGTLRLLP